MNAVVSIPGREIVATGSLVLDEGQSNFRVAVEDIVLDFVFVPGTGDPRADASQPSPKSARFTLSNFDNPLGTSYALPNVVTIMGRQISATFFIHAINQEPTRRLVSYTLSAAAR